MNRGSLVRPMVIWLVCSLLGPNPLPSQQHVATGDWNRVRNLPPGTPIWVKTRAGAYHGELIGATSETVRLDSDERSFPGRTTRRRELRQEDVLEIRRFSRCASALAGAGIGAGVGTGIGLAIDFSARSNEDRGLATVLFALLGSLFGWGVGRHSTLIKGDTIYVAP
ncbi:MAG: hypothetical protein ACM3ZB_16175 [bacterium]